MKNKIKVGLVENDLEFRDTTESRLRNISYISNVHVWGSAEEYLRDRKRPLLDIIFLDIILPYRNGADLALDISRENPETGIIMLVYLREAIEQRGGLEKIKSLEELRQAVIEGAVHRLRPKLLTEGVAIIAIFPMVFATGVGGEILAPMALPVLGGLLIADEVVDIFLPVRFYWVRRARWLKLHGKSEHAS